MNTNTMELNTNEMEQVNGGKNEGGYADIAVYRTGTVGAIRDIHISE